MTERLDVHPQPGLLARPPTGWWAELLLRARRLFWLKLFGTTGVIAVFFVGYFHVLRHPVGAVTVMPITAVDALVPFQPAMLWPYLSLWFYVGVAPGLQLTLRHLLVYALWASGLGLSGLVVFYLWPTAVPPMLADVSDWPAFQLLQGVDASGNACPSMHVAFAAFSAIRLGHLLAAARAPAALQALNLAWVLAIAWSTLAIRQHVFLDALAGALLGCGFAWLSLRWAPGVFRSPRARLRGAAHEGQ